MSIIKTYKIIIVLTLLLASCDKDDRLKESQLDFSVAAKTDLDKWIETNFLDPFNIYIYYEWDQNLVDNNRYLFPPNSTKVKSGLEIVKKIWIDSYSKIGGADFVKKISPREFVLVGGVNLNPNGTRTMGLAEAGQRIVLFEVSTLDPKNRAQVTQFIHTVQHEYIHILNQTKPFDEEAWSKLTPAGYTSTWYTESMSTSNSLGFLTPYARLNIFEDFAETASTILMNSREQYDLILNGIANENGKAMIKAKEALVVSYYRNAFNIDFYALRDEIQNNIEAVIKN